MVLIIINYYSPIKTTNYSSFPEFRSPDHVQYAIASSVLIPISNFLLFEFLYGVFELRGVDGHPVVLGILQKQLVSFV